MSKMLAVCPDAGKRARVVVPAAPERIESFAYGVEDAPIATRSDDVERVMEPILFVVHPPPVEAPPVEIVPQTMFPLASVVSA
jgi:hypothetical protein